MGYEESGRPDSFFLYGFGDFDVLRRKNQTYGLNFEKFGLFVVPFISNLSKMGALVY
ncbi:hypothetical protein SAMN04488100_11162 [Alkalibacterium putridalgicola]|uniref:Uncharacterized protein n=1 Tax=Alkalibacterium putridalgicola TaxID=426703 RepID=A0A1H7T9Q7_9LACT|nr:hypothetical protein APU01nite_13350 [Alkalibacterium putridalgicola]SEL81620.1 hypothetical protein SAMN04488100_11162 [Alkalibacterium putridalgicola]